MKRRQRLYVGCSQRTLACVIVVICLLIGFPSFLAQAQTPVDADMQRYCREKVSNSAYEMRMERWGVVHYCNQGGTRQNVDLAEACRLTTGSREFRQDGQRVYCIGSGTKPAQTTGSGALDMQQYCRDRFPNSAYEQRAERWGITHYCRRPGATGGFTLLQIDLAEACKAASGASDYTKVNDRVVCGSGSVATPTGTYKWPDGSIFHGPLKNGKPHGIGWTRILPTRTDWIGDHRDGKPIGAHLASRKGQLICWNLGAQLDGLTKVMQRLSLSECVHLQKYLSEIR